MIDATLYSDPACPWAYSESPALRVIEWRYGDQLDWRLAVIGLTEDASQYAPAATRRCAARSASSASARYGMPFAPAPKPRVSATARACRAVVAARLANPGSEWRVFRAIQLANFNTPLVLEDDDELAAAIADRPGYRRRRDRRRPRLPRGIEAYERTARDARPAAGSAAELQGKTATTDGPVRFTAPSVVFRSNGTALVAGGFQPVEAYDVLIANLDPNLAPRAPPETPEPLLERFEDGLTTQEVAALMTHGNDAPDRRGGRGGAARAGRRPAGPSASRWATTPWLGLHASPRR